MAVLIDGDPSLLRMTSPAACHICFPVPANGVDASSQYSAPPQASWSHWRRCFIAGVVMDITSRRNTVDAMHLCDKALASTSEAIIITDPNLPDNPIIYCNQGFEALTGL